jgi:hypothetical protein
MQLELLLSPQERGYIHAKSAQIENKLYFPHDMNKPCGGKCFVNDAETMQPSSL